MNKSDTVMLFDVISDLDGIKCCCRCGKPIMDDLRICLTPWATRDRDNRYAFMGIYLMFLCLDCKNTDPETASDIVRLQETVRPQITPDPEAWRGG